MYRMLVVLLAIGCGASQRNEHRPLPAPQENEAVETSEAVVTTVQEPPPAAETEASAPALRSRESGFDLFSDPVGCSVKLDGLSIGRTPLQIRDLSVGEHVVELSHNGYQTKSETIVVKLNVADRINIQLEADLPSP